MRETWEIFANSMHWNERIFQGEAIVAFFPLPANIAIKNERNYIENQWFIDIFHLPMSYLTMELYLSRQNQLLPATLLIYLPDSRLCHFSPTSWMRLSSVQIWFVYLVFYIFIANNSKQLSWLQCLHKGNSINNFHYIYCCCPGEC